MRLRHLAAASYACCLATSSCRAASTSQAAHHTPTPALTTTVDSFRYLRETCGEDGYGGNLTISAVAATEQEVEASQVGEGDALEGLTPELVSFEEWKKRQMETTSKEEMVDMEDVLGNLTVAAHPDVAEDGKNPDLDKPPAMDVKVETTTTSGKPLAASSTPKTSSSPHRYNYASPDCSARIHSSSSLTQHASSLLHKSKDRYMLTPCSAKEHWVVIELCDDIRIEAVEVGMFEFYSGVVREVVLSVGGEDDDDREDEDEDEPDEKDEDSNDPGSTRSQPSHKKWQQVGRFVGRNVRGTQTFTLSNPTSFHRLLRIDFPSHYGNEYYCPVSSVKVWGMNQMEAFRWEQRRSAREKEDEDRGKRQSQVSQAVAQESAKDKAVEEEATTSTLSETVIASSPEASATIPSVATQATMSTPVSTATSAQQSPSSPTAPGLRTGTETSSIHITTQKAESTASAPSAESSTTSSSSSAQQSSMSTTSTVSETASPSSEKIEIQSSVSSTRSPPASASSTTQTSNRVTTSETRSATTPTASSVTPSVSATSRSPLPSARTDSSESIYAFIIRRLNALEGNTTLTAMYVEEQFKATRALLSRIEKNLETRHNELAADLKKEKDQERASTEKRLSTLVAKLEKQVSIVERDRRLMANQIRALADEVTYEKRRGIVQLLLTLVLVVLGALLLSRNLEATLIPQPHSMRKKTWFQEKQPPVVIAEKSEIALPLERVPLPDRDIPSMPKVRTMSSAKPHRPTTPPNGKIRYRTGGLVPSRLTLAPFTSGNASLASGTAFSARSGSGGFTASGDGVGPTRRLAKSAHLHTIEARGVRQRMREEAQHSETQTTPRQTGLRLLPEINDQNSEMGMLPSANMEGLLTPSRSVDDVSSGYEDETGGSASEVESEAANDGKGTSVRSPPDQRTNESRNEWEEKVQIHNDH